MALFGLIFLVVALILIGVGIFVGAVVCCIAAVLVAVGVLSSSVVVLLLTRRLLTTDISRASTAFPAYSIYGKSRTPSPRDGGTPCKCESL
jgi:hypothetical protein